MCLFVPCLLWGPLTDLRQTWWVYVGGPPICPWGVLFRKGQRVDGSTGHFHFPTILYMRQPHATQLQKAPFALLLLLLQSLIRHLLLHCISTGNCLVAIIMTVMRGGKISWLFIWHRGHVPWTIHPHHDKRKCKEPQRLLWWHVGRWKIEQKDETIEKY